MSQGYSSPPQSSGGGKVLTILLVIVGVIGLLCAGVCGGCYLLIERVKTEANKQFDQGFAFIGEERMRTHATYLIQHNSQIAEKLGTPLEVKTVSPSSIDMAATSTNLVYKVQGSQAAATAEGEGRRKGTTWNLTSLKIKYSDGTAADIDIIPLNEIPLNDKPINPPEAPTPGTFSPQPSIPASPPIPPSP